MIRKIIRRERAERSSNVFRVREEDTFLIIERAIRSGDVKIRDTAAYIFFSRQLWMTNVNDDVLSIATIDLCK